MAAPSGVRLRPEASRAARIHVLIAALVAAGLTGCAPPAAIGHETTLRAGGALIRVCNDELDDVVVYLVHGGTLINLGVAPGTSRRMIAVPPELLVDAGGVVLATGRPGRPIERVSSPLDVAPGHVASWLVQDGRRIERPIPR